MEVIHSYIGCKWIEKQSEKIYKHIHHALCGHGGERCIKINKKEILVDGFEPETNTIYQFYGCKWHGCPCSNGDGYRYKETLYLETKIKDLGYDVISVWEYEKTEVSNTKLKKEFTPYLYFIVYDFEALLNKLNNKKAGDLTFNNKHVSVSVGINDNLTNKQTFLINPNPVEVIKEFTNYLQVCGKTIAEKVSSMYPMIDKDSIPEGVQKQ